MFVKRHIAICRECWYYLFILSFIVGGAILRDINLLIVVAGMMVGPLLFSWRFVIVSLRRLDVRRRLPDGICAGDLLVVDVTAANGRRRLGSWSVVVEDQIHRDGTAKGNGRKTAKVMFPYVAAGGDKTTAYHGRLARRGRYRFGPLKVSTRFPLGLIRRTVVVDQIDDLVVCPRLGRLASGWSQMLYTDRLSSHRSRRRRGSLEADFYGLRNWRTGDSRRWIHWRTSAKRGELFVRQFEQQRNQDLALFLDLWQPTNPSQEHLEHVELVVSFAATVVADVCRRGASQLFVGAAGRTVSSVGGAASMVLLQEVMEQLAVTEAGDEDRLPGLLDRSLNEVRPGTKMMIIGTHPTTMSDTDRFAAVWDDPQKRNSIRRIVCVDVGGDELSQYFRVEPSRQDRSP